MDPERRARAKLPARDPLEDWVNTYVLNEEEHDDNQNEEVKSDEHYNK